MDRVREIRKLPSLVCSLMLEKGPLEPLFVIAVKCEPTGWRVHSHTNMCFHEILIIYLNLHIPMNLRCHMSSAVLESSNSPRAKTTPLNINPTCKRFRKVIPNIYVLVSYLFLLTELLLIKITASELRWGNCMGTLLFLSI